MVGGCLAIDLALAYVLGAYLGIVHVGDDVVDARPVKIGISLPTYMLGLHCGGEIIERTHVIGIRVIHCLGL